jgi:hypothetical protein
MMFLQFFKLIIFIILINKTTAWTLSINTLYDIFKEFSDAIEKNLGSGINRDNFINYQLPDELEHLSSDMEKIIQNEKKSRSIDYNKTIEYINDHKSMNNEEGYNIHIDNCNNFVKSIKIIQNDMIDKITTMFNDIIDDTEKNCRLVQFYYNMYSNDKNKIGAVINYNRNNDNYNKAINIDNKFLNVLPLKSNNDLDMDIDFPKKIIYNSNTINLCTLCFSNVYTKEKNDEITYDCFHNLNSQHLCKYVVNNTYGISYF